MSDFETAGRVDRDSGLVLHPATLGPVYAFSAVRLSTLYPRQYNITKPLITAQSSEQRPRTSHGREHTHLSLFSTRAMQMGR
jgi:hypothetical protein